MKTTTKNRMTTRTNANNIFLLHLSAVLAVGLTFIVLFAMPFFLHAQDIKGTVCYNAVQGKIAWNYNGNTDWTPSNIARLCRGAESSVEPARCFQEVMHGGVSKGGAAQWKWWQAVNLCQGTRDADATIDCFQERVNDGSGWRQAIQACRREKVAAANAIHAKYLALNASDQLGEPVGPVWTNPNESGYRRGYEHGRIYWSNNTGAHVIYDGPIWDKWADQGWEQGKLGYPVEDPKVNPDKTGKRQNFEHGHIYWHPKTGAHIIYDSPIWDKWADQRWEQGKLGYPVEDPKINPHKTGKRQRFEHGYIYWSNNTGAHIIYDGPIWDKWADQGWEQGKLGYPVEDPKVNPDKTGKLQQFEHGYIYWSSNTGTHIVYDISGARIVIRDRGRGLSATDKKAINDAFTDALRMANIVTIEIEAVWDQPGRVRKRRERRRDAWSAHTNFTKWFGTSRRHILIRRVRRRIKKLRKWLTKGRIVAIAHSSEDFACRGNTNARSRVPRRPLKVHLCPSWFTQTPSRRAAIVIHELVHELGFTHPEGTTTREEALALASRNSRRARRSPENFEHLYELYFF